MTRKESAHVFPAAPLTAEGPQQAKGALPPWSGAAITSTSRRTGASTSVLETVLQTHQ